MTPGDRPRLAAKILGFSVLAAVVFGILFDAVSVHLSLEYFTEFHPTLVPTQNPWLLALLWGTVATWWVGAILGTLLAIAATVGKLPPTPFPALPSKIVKTLVLLFPLAWTSRLIAYFVLNQFTPADLPDRSKKIALAANLVMHNVAYFAAAVLFVVLAVQTFCHRKLPDSQPRSFPKTPRP